MVRTLALLGRTLSLLLRWRRSPLLRWTSLRRPLLLLLLLLTWASGPRRILISTRRSLLLLRRSLCLLLAPTALHRRCLSLRVLSV